MMMLYYLQQGGPSWVVELGRRDGIVSRADQAAARLPSSLSTADALMANFAAMGLTPRDMATLSGMLRRFSMIFKLVPLFIYQSLPNYVSHYSLVEFE